MSNKLNMVVGSDNVFHDLGFAEPEAQNLLLRADLVSHIRKVILKLDITQAEAAQRAGISQPRMNDRSGEGPHPQIHARRTRQCGGEVGLHRQAVCKAGGLKQ